MGKTYEKIEPKLAEFILSQKMFFVATAPLEADGLVNLSPKGLDCFRILNERTVAYIDLSGSGIETIAHLKQNGRYVLMFCAFEGPPNIVRLHGKGRAVEKSDPEWAELAPLFPQYLSARAILVFSVDRVSDSCGFSVPKYDYVEQRDTLVSYAEKKGPEGIRASQEKKNLKSLDGLPGLRKPSL